jgi:hypothetical protein
VEQLIEAIRNGTALLFVGAGVSQNLKLPSWGELVGQMGAELGYDPDVFRTFGDYLELAEYYRSKRGGIASLRSWMDRSWHDPAIKIEQSRIHELIVKLGCPLIYTTNFDRWLERAHECHGVKYVKIASAADFAKALPGVTQIVKFHGDFDGDDNDLVISEGDYFRRLGFESALDVKLRADLIGRVALFIGYSLSDINVRYMLFKLHQLWEGMPPFARPKSYVHLSRPNPVKEEVLERRGIIAVSSEVDDPGLGLEKFLDGILRDAFA